MVSRPGLTSDIAMLTQVSAMTLWRDTAMPESRRDQQGILSRRVEFRWVRDRNKAHGAALPELEEARDALLARDAA